jgi:hypothetical protein
VRVGVRVEHLPHTVFVEQHAAELGVPAPQRGPLLGGELTRLQERAGVQVGVHGGQRDQVRRPHGPEQPGDLAALGDGVVEGVAAAVQRGRRERVSSVGLTGPALGLTVPGDLSVVGYDDSRFGRIPGIDLTSVRQDIKKQARLAVKAVVERLERPTRKPKNIALKPQLVVRGTTAPPRSAAS